MKKFRTLTMILFVLSIYACSNTEEYDVEVENKRTTLANKSQELYIERV